ncbi:MAG: hypothetical protein ACE1ZI_06465, partial [Acidobacteriota bacterium]
MNSLFADVAVPLPLFQTFTYSVPDSLGGELQPGCRVLVPFGTRHLVGLVTQVHRESREGTVKPILETLDRKPLISPSLLKLGLWVASYYLSPPGEALRVMLPPGFDKANLPDQKAGIELLTHCSLFPRTKQKLPPPPV